MSEPKHNKGKSKQDVGTPQAFIDAVEERFGLIERDLAATEENSVGWSFYSPEQDSLAQDWAGDCPSGLLWLNPPFADIRPWAMKCVEESARRHGLIAMLTPAGVSTRWFHEVVEPSAFVLDLTPRLRFVGHANDFPKDMILSLFGYGLRGRATWRWRL